MFGVAALSLLAAAPFVAALPNLAKRAYVTPPPGPKGGLGLNSTPEYRYMSDFDFQSLNLALNQEWIELDLFHYGLAKFSDEEFEAAGLDAEDRFLLEFMADQEVGHATLLGNLLQGQGAKQCNYTYPFETVRDFIDFSQKLTRFGEAGVYGFLEHLDSRAAAELLLQSITTEARQQMIFRQFEGLFPMPIYFTPGIPQTFAWTLLAPYLVSCPAGNPHINFTNFPGLNIVNNPNASILTNESYPDITNNRSVPLSKAGREVVLQWELPGKTVGYNSSYVTSTTAGTAKYAAWISQLNVTYTPLYDLNGTHAKTKQPGGHVFGPKSNALVNGTEFIVITDANPYLTPFNLSQINTHVVAGPAMYQSG